MKTARVLGRRKRFLVDMLGDEGPFTAHTNNTGSMLGLLGPRTVGLVSLSDNPKRKHAATLELVRGGPGAPDFWVGVNTMSPNRMLQAAFAAGRLPELCGMQTLTPEPAFADGRLDALAEGPAGRIWIEAKNVTLVEDDVALFPDAATERGRKHLVELARLARAGQGAALFFLVQRPDARCFGPADAVDAEYAALLWQAVDAGVAVWAYQALVSQAGIDLGPRLPLTPASCR